MALLGAFEHTAFERGSNFERTPIEDGTDREPRVAHEQL